MNRCRSRMDHPASCGEKDSAESIRWEGRNVGGLTSGRCVSRQRSAMTHGESCMRQRNLHGVPSNVTQRLRTMWKADGLN